MASEYPYDVFISYSSQDQAWVRGELLTRLEEAGLKVCIDFRDFEVGEPSISAMERAILTSRKTLLVLTPAYLESGWTEFEYLLLQPLDPANRQRRLIPLVRKPCAIPPRIAYLTSVDFTAPDDRSWRRLIGALRDQASPAPDAPPPRSTNQRTMLMMHSSAIYLLALTTGIMSNIVSSFLLPSLEQRQWLAVILFIAMAALGLWLEWSYKASGGPKDVASQPDASQSGPLSRMAQLPMPLRWALIGLIAPLALIVWYLSPLASDVVAQHAPQCLPGRVCVLVTPIGPEDSSVATEITRELTYQIQRVLDRAAQSRYTVRIGGNAPDAVAALEQARQDGAALAVWGEVRTEISALRIEFGLVDLLGVGESATVRTYRAEPLLYNPISQRVECFNCFYGEIAAITAHRAQLVAYTVAGLVDYVQDNPERAKFPFAAALYCAGEPVDATWVAALQPACTPAQSSSDWNPGLLYYYLGKSLVLQGDFRQGIEQLQQAATHSPLDPAAWIGVGSAYQSWLVRHDAPEAVAAFRKAEANIQALREAMLPEQWALLDYHLGLIQELQQNNAAAIQYYTAAAERFGSDAATAYTTLVNLGRVQRREDELDQARQSLEQAARSFSEAPWAYLELAKVYENNRALAERQIELARQAAPNEAYVDITEAELCADAWADRACAADAYTRAREKRPNSGWLHSRIGIFYLPTNPPLAGQSWETAREHLETAAQVRPNDPWAHERLAYVLHNLGEYEQAAAEYGQAITLAFGPSQAAGLYCNLGRSQQLAGDIEPARQSFEHCHAQARDNDLRARAEDLLRQLAP
ncbi:MAG: TIR domain-containing protein [Caldilineaceae bacterium]|nr:TIR domain-containing protein [Caldilineaceae bacterium]